MQSADSAVPSADSLFKAYFNKVRVKFLIVKDVCHVYPFDLLQYDTFF